MHTPCGYQAADTGRRFSGGEGGIRTRGGGFIPRTHLAGEPNQPLWHLPVGGGRGIRTHDGLLHTCFQDRRLKPLGHPST
jgi:hypothetical protein